MNITPNKLSIAQLFASNNEQFIVPAYQRRYAWGHNQTAALFDDIDMLQEGDGHLFGMIILHSDLHQGGLNKPELVDGQQRLTTLTILLKALQTRFHDLGNTEKVSEIEKMLTCYGYDSKKLPKLELGDLDHDDLSALLAGDQRDYTNANIVGAFYNFKQWIEKLSPEKLNKFYFSLCNVAVIIRLDVGKAQDAYKLFETINNRGLRLSPTDIIKNFLLGHAAKINQDTLKKTKSLWSMIITNLDGLDSDDFFRQYLCSILTRKVSSSQMVYEFKKFYFKNVIDANILGEFGYYVDEISTKDEEELGSDQAEEQETTDEETDIKISILELLRKIKSTSDTYRKIENEKFEDIKINRHIKYLNMILSKPSYIFLMHFLQKDFPISIKIAILEMIESFMLRRHICERRTGELDDIFSKIMTIEDSEDIVKDLKQILSDYMPSDDEFKSSFPKHVFKGKLTNRAKYVLEQLEYQLNGNTKEFLIASGTEVELEHIIPQTISTKKSKEDYGDWEEYLGPNSLKLHDKFVYLIGNMTLLADELNIQASNNPFVMKKKCYRKSNILITKEITELSKFKFLNVEKRGKQLAVKAVKIWQL